jgi:transposase
MAHGQNANLVRHWRAGRGVQLACKVLALPEASPAPRPAHLEALPPVRAAAEFVQIAMPATPEMAGGAPTKSVAPPPAPSRSATPDPHIHVELRRGPLHLTVRWPTSAAGDCMAWLRELSLGLHK